jgi:pimeloyl-ACP methyl ester carboxylesterase
MQPRYPFVREAGAGAAVLCLHSSTSSSSQWLPLMQRLADGCRVIAPDLYAQGKNAWPPSGRDALLEDVALVEAVAGAGHVHLIGHSYGGAVALRYAMRHPGRVRSLVLYEPAVWHLLVGDPGEVFDVAAAIEEQVASGDAAGAARDFVDYWNGHGSWERMQAHHRERLAAQMPQVVAHFTALFADPTPPAAYGALDMPVLLLCGGAGPRSAQRAARRLAEAMPGAAYQRFPRLGHMGPMSAPDEVNAAIERFLEKQGQTTFFPVAATA